MFEAKGFMRFLKIEKLHGKPEYAIMEITDRGIILRDKLFNKEFARISKDVFHKNTFFVNDSLNGMFAKTILNPERSLKAFECRLKDAEGKKTEQERKEMLEGAKLAYKFLKGTS